MQQWRQWSCWRCYYKQLVQIYDDAILAFIKGFRGPSKQSDNIMVIIKHDREVGYVYFQMGFLSYIQEDQQHCVMSS